jgi:hypothetical protein
MLTKKEMAVLEEIVNKFGNSPTTLSYWEEKLLKKSLTDSDGNTYEILSTIKAFYKAQYAVFSYVDDIMNKIRKKRRHNK